MTPPISINHAGLKAKFDAGTLVPGQKYSISDFRTKHCIIQRSGATPISPAVINVEASDNPIIVTAQTNNKFEPYGYQPSNPDDIIKYDISDVLCEDGATARTGLIQYRLDTNRNVSAWYDWRVVKFRRYKVNTTTHTAYNAGTTYAKNALCTYNNKLFISNTPGNVGHTPESDSYWTLVFDSIDTSYHCLRSTATNYGTFTITPDTTQYKDFYTFHNLTDDSLSTIPRCIHIGKLDQKQFAATRWCYNNIVHQMPDNGSSTFLGDLYYHDDCFDMNFICTTGKNSLLSNVFFPLMGILNAKNLQNSTLWGRTQGMVIGTGASRIVGYFSSNVIGDECRLISAQYSASNNFQGTNVNVNIVGVLENSSIGSGNSRLVFDRPVDPIYYMSNNVQSGSIVGAHFGSYNMKTGRLSSTDSTINLISKVTFTGAAGKGAVGSVTLEDDMVCPAGWRIAKTEIQVTSAFDYNPDAIFNFGFTGDADAGIDDSNGALADGKFDNTGYIKIEQSAGPSGSNTNAITMEVKGGDVAEGALTLKITLEKIQVI